MGEVARGLTSRWTALSGAALAIVLTGPPMAAQQLETAEEIIDHVDRLLRGESSRAVMTMEVVTENWSRELDMEVWSLGRDYSLIRIESPRSEAGTATLMADQQVWNYLPRADRTIKIPASMMMGSWMGSHFTNDDLVKESQMIEDYDIEIAFEGERDGVEVWEFRLTPKPEAAVVWGHVEEQVRKDDYMPTWARYYDEDGELIRTMEFGEYRLSGARLVPTVMHMLPVDKPGERTTIIYDEIEFDVGLTEDFFSLRNLRSRN